MEVYLRGAPGICLVERWLQHWCQLLHRGVILLLPWLAIVSIILALDIDEFIICIDADSRLVIRLQIVSY